MTSPRIVVVAGASGNLGKLVCDALISRATNAGIEIEVRGLVRRAATQLAAPEQSATTGAAQRVELVPVDYARSDDLERACQGAYSGDFTKLPVGSHRNFDLRRRFHEEAAMILERTRSTMELTSVFQGGFTELLGSGWVLFDYRKRSVNYFGAPDGPMEFTTWSDTADFAAAVALDEQPTPRYLYPAGARMTPREAQALALRVTGERFALKRVMPVPVLRLVIALMRLFKPGKPDEVMPLWVALQYGYCGALGVMSPTRLDNDRYPDIAWQGVESVIERAFLETQESP